MGRARRWRKQAIFVTAFSLAFSLSLAQAAGLSWEQNPAVRVDLEKEGIFNANRTGQGGVDGYQGYLRNVAGQNVHSDFFLNSNACASCHMTHTALGRSLLFQPSVYNTCSACHFSATMNTYDILADDKLPGGRFYDEDFNMEGRRGSSFHLATGIKKLGDAPGADTNAAGLWDSSFTCGSCHAPHGSYGRRQLNLNPNGQAKRYNNITLTPADGGNGRYRPGSHADKVPWLYYDSDSAGFAGHALVINNGAGQDVTGAFFVHYKEGYVEKRDDAGPGPYTISFSQALVVDIEVVGQKGNESVIYRSGTVDYCTACHTGYLDTDSAGRTVTRHNTFTHTINTNLDEFIRSAAITPDQRLPLEKSRDSDAQRLVCLTCHFAHGTDAELMVNRNFEPMYAEGADVPQKTYTLRFGEIGGEWEACFTCHGAGGPGSGTSEPAGEPAAEDAPQEEPLPNSGDAANEPATAEQPAAPAEPLLETPLLKDETTLTDSPLQEEHKLPE